MPTPLQNMMIGDELRTSIRLLKSGLRELNRTGGANDFYHLPILLLSSGFERLMKVVICCYYLKEEGKFPTRKYFPRGNKGHDLEILLKQIINKCFSDSYLEQVPAAKQDILFLRHDEKLLKIVQILSDFGQAARYYNLNVVLNEENPGPCPDDELQRLRLEILKEDPLWEKKIVDSNQGDVIYRQINQDLTVQCERLARSLSRLFTIGDLGQMAKQISVYSYDFLTLRDDQLGTIDYESVRI